MLSYVKTLHCLQNQSQ